ncbi:MAG: DUF2357 domain-containing protein, partial [bacterium]|nr:DUF2357 domain-containing protein [bacterium]
VGLNEVDDFAKIFINILKSGNTTLYQKERRERRVFDDAWMTSVEEAIPVIDRITRSPRENLKKVQQIVPVERARRIDNDTIRHLASHSENIKSINSAGEVVPSKVMTSYNESDLGTYENRFIKTLVDKLYIFIEKRYDLIVQKLHTEYVNFLNVKSTANWNDADIEFDVTMKIKQNLVQDEIDRKNQELFDRMTYIRTNITNFKMSSFMNQMRAFNPVQAPIMKTNIIQKNSDFRQCYELWILMDSIDQIGFDVDVYERDVKFDDKYIDQLYTSLLVLYSTVAYNQKEEFILNQDNPYEYRLIKRPKLSKMNPSDTKIQPGTIQVENNQLNQYYLEQIKKSNYARFKTLKEAGISIEESIEIVFKQIGQITNAVYEDYMNHNYVLENAKSLEEKISIQEQVMDLYRKIEQIKREDMRSFTTQRAIALLQLRNLKDELKLKQEVEKEESLRLKEELRLEKERDAAQKAQERANRLKRIEREKALLEEARVKREEQKAIDSAKKLTKKMAEKEKEKVQAQKKRVQEKLKKEKLKALEKEKLAKQKLKEKEQAKKLKEKELEKEKLAKQKLKEKEQARKQKEIQLEQEKIKKEKQKEIDRINKQNAKELKD